MQARALARIALLWGEDVFLLREAALARFDSMLEVLEHFYVAEGWTVDHGAAEQARKYLLGHIAESDPDPEYETDEGLKAFLDFVHDHGQCITYVFDGSVETMLCMLASASPRIERIAGGAHA